MEIEIEERFGPVIFDNGVWVVGGLIASFHREWERLRVKDDSLSTGLPAQCLDPVQIAEFLGVSVEEMDWPGPAASPTQEALDRIEAKLDAGLGVRPLASAQANYLSIKEAAALTRLSYSHVRRAVLSGDLPASNVGSATHPVYRIARTALAAWMDNKKGGSVLPPKSERRGLIDRYFG